MHLDEIAVEAVFAQLLAQCGTVHVPKVWLPARCDQDS